MKNKSDERNNRDILLSNLTTAIQNFHYREEMLEKTKKEKR